MSDAAIDAPEFLTTADLCKRWKVHRNTLMRWRSERRVPFVRVGRRFLHRLSDIEEVERAHGQTASAA